MSLLTVRAEVCVRSASCSTVLRASTHRNVKSSRNRRLATSVASMTAPSSSPSSRSAAIRGRSASHRRRPRPERRSMRESPPAWSTASTSSRAYLSARRLMPSFSASSAELTQDVSPSSWRMMLCTRFLTSGQRFLQMGGQGAPGAGTWGAAPGARARGKMAAGRGLA